MMSVAILRLPQSPSFGPHPSPLKTSKTQIWIISATLVTLGLLMTVNSRYCRELRVSQVVKLAQTVGLTTSGVKAIHQRKGKQTQNELAEAIGLLDFEHS